MMEIFDIIIFESSLKEINNGKLKYLRILCTIPITLLELNENRILASESVSEIESIFNDLILHTLIIINLKLLNIKILINFLSILVFGKNIYGF